MHPGQIGPPSPVEGPACKPGGAARASKVGFELEREGEEEEEDTEGGEGGHEGRR